MGLVTAYEKSLGSEREFEHGRILFIGCNSYDGPAIAVIQGLEELGFDIHTIDRDNINSWFCNTVIDDPQEFDYDFVLSNLHWGTRWSHYEEYDLDELPHVLIDGDDNPWLCESWRCKHERHKEEYVVDPPEDIKNKHLAPYRWIEPVGEYEPDIVFTSQKRHSDHESVYLPFGIQREYLDVANGERAVADRSLDLTHITGPGGRRKRMKWFLSGLTFVSKFTLDRFAPLPGSVFNGTARGDKIIPDGIEEEVETDENIHSYHRWVMYEDYHETLANSKMLVMPGIDDWPGWGNKRHYEALANGCLILWIRPPIDTSEYPMGELFEYGVCDSYGDFLRKYRYLQRDSKRLERLRKRTYDRALKYFTPKPVARYFLNKITERT